MKSLRWLEKKNDKGLYKTNGFTLLELLLVMSLLGIMAALATWGGSSHVIGNSKGLATSCSKISKRYRAGRKGAVA